MTVTVAIAGSSIGAVIGASTAGWVKRISRQGLAVLVAVALWGGCIAAFGVVHSIVLAFILLALAGACREVQSCGTARA